MKRKWLWVLGLSVVLVMLLGVSALAADKIEINSDNFPDWCLQQLLSSQYDPDGDGWIDPDDVTELSFEPTGVLSDLTGISYFTRLTKLECYQCNLSYLDVSKNTALVSLDCGRNHLTSLDVSKNSRLSDLNCVYNAITSLNVSHNSELISLSCVSNQLTDLDVSKNTKLQVLFCNANKLKNLKLDTNTKLERLNCAENQIAELNVRNNEQLQVFTCSGNKLQKLDVSKNTKLTTLSCAYNKLASLDVSNNLNLGVLYCDNNMLTSLDLSNHSNLIALTCDNNGLTSLKLKVKDLYIFSCENNRYKIKTANNQFDLSTLPGFDASKASKWKGGSVKGKTLTITDPDDISYQYQVLPDKKVTFHLYTSGAKDNDTLALNEKNFPDKLFRQYLERFDNDGDGKIDPDVVTEINVENIGIKSMKGLSFFTNLSVLECSNNKLSSLDVSKNTALKNLYCDYNSLTKLDVSKNRVLAKLYCNGNALTELDVSKNTVLTELSCASNRLTSLDLSKNKKLSSGYYGFNEPILTVAGGRIDLSTLPGFNVKRITSLSGATLKGTTLIILDPDEYVFYEYDCGNGAIAGFHLNIKAVKAKITKVVLADTKYYCTGEPIEPKVKVYSKVGGSTIALADGQYQVVYKNNIKAGRATVTVTGTGFFKGTAKATFTIAKAKLSTVKLEYSSKPYTGNAYTPAVTVKAKVNGKTVTLSEGIDFTVSYKDNVNAGTALVTVKGKGIYTGTLTKKFSITPVKILKVTLSNYSLPYTGKERKPIPTVTTKINGQLVTLVKGTDYTVKYENNVEIGTATVTITGKGNYTGTITKTFTIVQK